MPCLHWIRLQLHHSSTITATELEWTWVHSVILTCHPGQESWSITSKLQTEQADFRLLQQLTCTAKDLSDIELVQHQHAVCSNTCMPCSDVSSLSLLACCWSVHDGSQYTCNPQRMTTNLYRNTSCQLAACMLCYQQQTHSNTLLHKSANCEFDNA